MSVARGFVRDGTTPKANAGELLRPSQQVVNGERHPNVTRNFGHYG